MDVDAAAEGKLYIPSDVSDPLAAVMETSTDGDGCAKGVPHAIVEGLRTAREGHLHLAIG